MTRHERPARGPLRSPAPPSIAALALIRIALLFGVLMFGATTLYIQRRGTFVAAPADSLETLRTVGIVLWLLAIGAVVFLRLRGTRIAGRPEDSSGSIIGWAIGEAVALFGGVHYFLSGRPEWYLNGVLFLVATFVIFPIRRERARR